MNKYQGQLQKKLEARCMTFMHLGWRGGGGGRSAQPMPFRSLRALRGCLTDGLGPLLMGSDREQA